MLIVLTGLIFYALIPGLGAFIVRRKWRVFRKNLIRSVSFPLLDYRGLRNLSSDGDVFRFFGALQALEGDSGIWLTDEDISIRVDLSGVPIYILPSAPELTDPIGETGYPEETPVRTKWQNIFSLPEGTKMFLSGKVVNSGGKTMFRDMPDERLFAVIYDCSSRAFFSHSIWTGRQRNEYWNPSTPGSLTFGSFILFIYFYLLLQQPYMNFPAGIALLFSLAPLILFFPPGLFFYYLYRYLWKKARVLRAERDLLKLPLSFFPAECSSAEFCEAELPSGCTYVMRKISPSGIPRDVVVRTTSLNRNSAKPGDYFMFTVSRGEGCSKPDPMAENVAVSGTPLVLSKKSSSHASKLEIVSLAAIAADGLLNGALILFAVTYLFG